MNGWRTIFLGDDNPWIFLAECALRTGLMFLIALVLFKVTGKKEVRQFSILELIVIIGLGSALSDPMIYTTSPVLPSVVAMAVTLLLYWAVNKWTNRAPRVEAMVEGAVTRVFFDGIVELKALDTEGMSPDEFFGELRALHVEHLGQVKAAYVEIDGKLSVFFHPDDEVRPGLPIAPEALAAGDASATPADGPVCCGRCGYTVVQGLAPSACPYCEHDSWVPAISFVRVA